MLPLLMASLLITANAGWPNLAIPHTSVPGPMIRLNQNQSVDQSNDHSFHTNQADKETFTMHRMTSKAPWSHRMQPAILPMYQETKYKNWFTGVTTMQASDWLIMYEGSLESKTEHQIAENDVWASGDYGATWDLIAGISEFGASNHTEAWGYQKQSSFRPRVAAGNCEDPSSDFVYSIGGATSSESQPFLPSNEIWQSSEGHHWWLSRVPGLPARLYSSCDVDVSGHVFTMGGVSVQGETFKLLNDVWTNFRASWQPTTLNAPWAARAEHLVLITENSKLGRDIMYVIGGMIDATGGKSTNDIWASSDAGANWVRMPNPKFTPRWGHAGITTKDGVIVVIGGADSVDGTANTMYTKRDIWASFDGAQTWSSCRTPDGAGGNFIRSVQGASLLTDGRLILASGQEFCPAGECQHQYYSYNDVWVSSFSLDDTAKLASLCDAKVPSFIGLTSWPSSTPVHPRSLFVMNPVTHNAPWSVRTEPALLRMEKPVQYQQASTGLTVSTPANWMLMYEGSNRYISWTSGSALENDVWASGDEGATWDVISGISWSDSRGAVNSSHPDTSFKGQEFAAQCEDPTNDDVYSIGGASYNEEDWIYTGTNLVQYSPDAQNWVIRKGSTFSPARYLASCDVSNTGVLILIGGIAQKSGANGKKYLLNDVWRARDQGKDWEYAGDAPFALAETQVVIYESDVFKADIVYVIGGYSKYDEYNDVFKTTNEVWASRDLGSTWAAINKLPGFTSRWGHAALVTPTGALMVAGGADTKTGKQADNLSLRDVWISLDGGYYWSSCRLPTGVDYIRTNQGAQLLEDNRVLFISGYSLYPGYHRLEYKDVFVSVASLDDYQALSSACKGVELPKGGKVGLSRWPGEMPPPEEVETEPKLTTKALIVVILVSIVMVLCIGFAVWSKRASLFPSMFGSSQTQMSDLGQTLFDNPRLPTEDEAEQTA